MHLPFDLSVAPMLLYRGDNCFIVAVNPGDEALQFGMSDSTLFASQGVKASGFRSLKTRRNCCAKCSAVAICGLLVVTASTQRCSSGLRCIGGFVSQNATSRTLGSFSTRP